MNPQSIIDASYLAAAFLFIMGLKRMSSPVTARSGILVAGAGMLVAVLASFLYYFGVNDAALPHLGTNFMLAAFTGYEIIGRVPAILHTPLMSGSNFVHGIVVVGAMYALLNATSTVEQVIGFIGVLLGAGNAAGGYVVTERMLEMFKPSDKKKPAGEQKKA